MFILPHVLLSKLVINFVITRGRDCLWSYLGQPWNTSLYPTRCEEPPEWAACVGCKVHNGIQDKETLLLRGLCQKTKFDTEYQGNVYSYYLPPRPKAEVAFYIFTWYQQWLATNRAGAKIHII